MASASHRVVIVGGGIHGVCTAYYLAQKGVNSIIIERSSIGAAASGKAGGFLARDWGYGPTIQLHQKSYDLHQQLASLLEIESYRHVDTLEVYTKKKGKNPASWLDGKVSSSPMDNHTAQVTPMELVQKMLASVSEPAEGKGVVEVLIDAVVGMEWTPTEGQEGGSQEARTVAGVRTKLNGVVPASSVVVCLGPWSGVMVEDWFGLPLPMEGVKSTSLVYNVVQEVRTEPFACFCDEDSNHCHLELYPRLNGELYVCGCGGSDHVSGDRLRAGGDCESAEHVQADPGRVAAARSSLAKMTSATPLTREPDVMQACLRPCMPDALPVMGAVPTTSNAYISCGHNCWGILWAPVCGLAMAEVVLEGVCTSVDLEPFSPERYMKVGVEKTGAGRGRKKGQHEVGEQW